MDLFVLEVLHSASHTSGVSCIKLNTTLLQCQTFKASQNPAYTSMQGLFLMQITPEEHDCKRWLTYSGILNSQTYRYITYWFGWTKVNTVVLLKMPNYSMPMKWHCSTKALFRLDASAQAPVWTFLLVPEHKFGHLAQTQALALEVVIRYRALVWTGFRQCLLYSLSYKLSKHQLQICRRFSL